MGTGILKSTCRLLMQIPIDIIIGDRIRTRTRDQSNGGTNSRNNGNGNGEGLEASQMKQAQMTSTTTFLRTMGPFHFCCLYQDIGGSKFSALVTMQHKYTM
jgi:hypothetical protein